MDWTEGRGAHVVVEAVGQSELVRDAVMVARRYGEVILLGSPRAPAIFDVTPMMVQIHLEAKYPDFDENTCYLQKSYCTDRDSRVGCSAGNSQIVITATGDVVACPFLYDFSAGSLRRDSLQKIWHTSSILNTFRGMKQSDLKGKCKTCMHVPEKCLGGCRAAAYLYNGDLCGEDPLCWA